MLTALSIANIVLIERLDLDFEAGLGVLTGETGAGKSILLDALGLALGARADNALVRQGTDKAQVTASFTKGVLRFIGGQTSKTDDNGKPHSISLGASDLVPASLWDADILRASKVLNTIDGSTDAVRVSNKGVESIATGAGPVQATHYALQGDMNRDLWFAGAKLVHVRFTAEDGSQIDYALR